MVPTDVCRDLLCCFPLELETVPCMGVGRLLSLIHIYHTTQTLSCISHNMEQEKGSTVESGLLGTTAKRNFELLWSHISSVCAQSVRNVPVIRRVDLSQFKAYSSCWKTETRDSAHSSSSSTQSNLYDGYPQCRLTNLYLSKLP